MDDLDAGRTDEQPFIYDSGDLTAVSWSKGNVIVDVHLWHSDKSVVMQSTGEGSVEDARDLRDLLDCAIWLAEQWQREIDEAGES